MKGQHHERASDCSRRLLHRTLSIETHRLQAIRMFGIHTSAPGGQQSVKFEGHTPLTWCDWQIVNESMQNFVKLIQNGEFK